MIDWLAVWVLLVDRKHFRGAIRGPGTALVGTVLTNQQLATKRVIFRSEADRVSIPMPPTDRLDDIRIVQQFP